MIVLFECDSLQAPRVLCTLAEYALRCTIIFLRKRTKAHLSFALKTPIKIVMCRELKITFSNPSNGAGSLMMRERMQEEVLVRIASQKGKKCTGSMLKC